MVCNEEKFNTKFRDKYRINREIMVKQYVEDNKRTDKVFIVYGNNSEDDSKVNATLYENGNNPKLAILDKKELPNDIKINDVLINNEGKLSIDEEATSVINNELEKLIFNLQKEQEEEMEQLRIEDHLYKISEIGTDRIWLYDITNSDDEKEEIEELEISEEILKSAVPEDVLIFKKGEYNFLEKNSDREVM